jgi:two-component system, NtrC family, nitrogen regulation sensor histidine kinase NtrY
MKVKIRFILFVALTHGIMALIAAFLLKYNAILFVVSEILILGSILYSISLFRAFVKPLDIMAAGLESLKEKDFSIKFTPMGQYELDQLIEVYNKMIDQLREERILANEKHNFLEKLLEASPSGIIVLDFDNKILGINPAAHQYLGIPANLLRGKTFQEIEHPLALSLASLQTNQPVIIQGSGTQTFKCHKANFIHKGFHQHFIILEELTAEILKTEKQAYEKVVRMMSHEINNTVGAVNSILDSVNKSRFKDDEEYSNVLQVCTERNKRMARFMSNFAEVVRLPEPKKEKADLHKTLKQTTLLFKETCLQKNIQINLELTQDEFILFYDEQQMEQVLINVLKNAVESIEQDGSITLITSTNPNRLIIRDTGAGIAPYIQPKLFSPFFSSKKEGQGIGLTLTKEILFNHGYNFSLTTKKKGITEFEVLF